MDILPRSLFIISLFLIFNKTPCHQLGNPISSRHMEIPFCKTSNGQRSFSYRGVTVWNQLSLEIKTAPSLAAFKTKLKSFLKDQRS